MTPMYRFFNWINTRHLIGRWRSTSSVAPSIPSSDSYSQEKPSSAGFSNSTSTTKQVHFADDCGEALESIFVIPIKDSSRRKFQETLEEAYIDGTGIVTGILRVTDLEPGRNILVRYTENEWKSYNQTKARRFDKKEYKTLSRVKNIKDSHSESEDDSSCDPPVREEDEEAVKFAFCFKVTRRKMINVELVIISTLDGAVDQRHEHSYRLSKNLNTTMPYGRGISCWS